MNTFDYLLNIYIVQAPPTVYQPAYNCGFTLPTDIFNQPPPAGFIYTSEAPPPYPGLGPQQPQTYPNPNLAGPATGYPQSATGYPQPATGYPQPATGYPQPATGYQQPATGYQQPATGYPQPAPGYTPASIPGYPAAPSYTPVSVPTPNYHTGPSQPGFNSNIIGYPSQQTYPPVYPPNGAPAYPYVNSNVYQQASAPVGSPEKKAL